MTNRPWTRHARCFNLVSSRSITVLPSLFFFCRFFDFSNFGIGFVRFVNERWKFLKEANSKLKHTRIQNTIPCGRYSWFKSRWKGRRREEEGGKSIPRDRDACEARKRRQSERIRDSNRRLSTIVPATNYVCWTGKRPGPYSMLVEQAASGPQIINQTITPWLYRFPSRFLPTRPSIGTNGRWKERNYGESWGLLSSYITVWVTPLVFA